MILYYFKGFTFTIINELINISVIDFIDFYKILVDLKFCGFLIKNS